ncbi:unnamed protein product [Closterium sp. NIES-53]
MRSLWRAQALYDAIVARYSLPATAALGRLLLPYLFPELSPFATVEDLVSHLRTSDARYHATVPDKFLDRNQPPIFITLYLIVTRLPDSLRSVTYHFLSLDPTSLTIDLLEQHLLAAETSAVPVGAARGTPRPPFFEGCSPSPLAPSYASAAAADDSVAEDVRAASTSANRRSSKGKGGRGGGSGSGGGGGGSGSGRGGSSGGSGGSGGGGGGSDSCPYVIRTGVRAGQTCGKLHTQHRCFSRLDDAWRAEFGDDVELPRWADLLKSRIAIFDLDYDAIPFPMYALFVSAEGDSKALHTFTLVSGASRYFFRDSTTLTPLSALVPVRLADPSGGPVVARPSTVLPCPAVPFGSLSGLHLPSFSTNLVSTAALQDAMVTTTTPGGQRVSICTCTRTGRYLATFTRQPGSSLYTLATKPPQTLLWHHRLGHPSLPRFRGMHSCLLVPGLPRSLPPLPPSPAPSCLPSAEGRQRTAPHSSFPTMTTPLQTLHMEVWGPARISGKGRERYFVLVVDNYTRYTTVFPLHSKGEVVDVLIPRIRTVRLHLRERFGQDLPVLPLHSNRGGEFSSNLLRDFCLGEGILQSFTLSDSPQQNRIAERRIGLVMEVARTSMIHAAAPHFLWPFAVRYTTHQLNLWPRVSLTETSPTLHWTGEVVDASVFRFYHPTSCRVLPFQDVTCDESVPFYRLFPYRFAPPPPMPLFLAPGPPPVDPLLPQGPAPSGVSEVDPLLGTAPVEVAVGSSAARSAASEGAASGGAEPRGAEPVGVEPGGAESEGAESEGAGSGGAEPAGEEPGCAEPVGVEPGGAESEGAESGGAEPRGPALSGGPAAGGAGDAGGAGVTAGAGGTGGSAAAGPGGARTRGARAAGTGGVGGSGAGGAGVGGTGAGGAGAVGAGAVDPGAGGAGGTVRTRPYFVPLLQQVLGVPSSTSLTPLLLCKPPDQSQPPLLSASPPPAPPYTEKSGGLRERCEPASRPVSPVRTARRIPRSRPPPVLGTHAMALRPSSVPLRVPLPAPLDSSLPELPDPESDRARAASPTVSLLLATAVTDPSLESAAASALVAELVDFAAACRLDYATALVGESSSSCPPSVGGECALSTDVLEDRQVDFECLAVAVPRFASMLLAPKGNPDAPDIPTPRSYGEAITGPFSSYWQAAMDAEMASWKSTVTYVDEVPPPGANIVDGMWIFREKWLPGSLHAFKARYVARGFSQRQGVDYFQTFSPTPKMTTLRVLLHLAAQRDYELHSLDFSTAFVLRRPVYSLCQEPREWQDTPRTTLAALGFSPATAHPSLFLRTDTSLPPFYILVYVDDLVFATADTEAQNLITRVRARRTITLTHSHMVHLVLQCFGFQFFSPQPTPLSTSHSLSAPPSDKSVEPSGPYPELVGFLITLGMGLVLGGRGPVVLIGHAGAFKVDDSTARRSSQGYTFSLGSDSVSWRTTRSSSVLSSSCEAEIYARAMAAQELRWLTYLLTDLGEQPRSPLLLTKHTALRYFLAQELQQRGQLRLAYVATRANTADVFTKALPPGDHQHFFAMLDLVPTLPHLLTA